MAEGNRFNADAWWAAWREADYSWDGLAKKEVAGAGTLQDYWRAEENALITSPDGKVRYTRFHLPFHWADGTPTGKAEWGQTEIAAFREEIAARLAAGRETAFDYGGEVDGAEGRAYFDGVVFPAGGFLGPPAAPEGTPDSLPTLHVRAVRAWFAGDVTFEVARFGPGAGFDNASFAGNAGFLNASFAGDAGFDNASFAGDAWFDNASFAGNAWFDNASFAGNAGFDNASFAGNAGFQNASFAGDAWFDNASFAGNARFDNAVFGEYVSFRGRGAQTLGEGEGQALALSATGGDRLDMKGRLEAAKDALPITRRAFPNITAERAFFFGDADFSNRDILAPSPFKNAVFVGLAEFHGSALHQGVSFQGADFESVLAPDSSRTRRAIRDRMKDALRRLHAVAMMKEALAGKDAARSAAWRARSRRWAERQGTPDAPPFWEWLEAKEAARAQEEGRDANAAKKAVREERNAEEKAFEAWRKTFEHKRASQADAFKARPEAQKSQRFEDVERAFRTLKLAMEENRDRMMEGEFFKLELRARSRRRDAAVPVWERWFSFLYRRSSGFGANAVWPLCWLLFAVLPGFALLYWALARGACLAPLCPAGAEALRFDADFGEAVEHSASRIFPFGAFGREREDYGPALEAFLTDQPLMAGFLGTLESLLAIILGFLFGLAIRRRFQIS